MSRRCLGGSGPSWAHFGSRRPWAQGPGLDRGWIFLRIRPGLESPWYSLGPSWAVLGPPWGRLRPSWGRLGAVLGRLGAVLGRLGAVLGPVLGPSWGRLDLYFTGTFGATAVCGYPEERESRSVRVILSYNLQVAVASRREGRVPGFPVTPIPRAAPPVFYEDLWRVSCVWRSGREGAMEQPRSLSVILSHKLHVSVGSGREGRGP